MLYFFEPGRSSSIQPYCPELRLFSTLATVAPDDRYREFTKDSLKVFLPLTTEDELVAIGRDMKTRPDFDHDLLDLYSDDEIRKRFATFKGVIRHVLPKDIIQLRQLHYQRVCELARIDLLGRK